MGSALPVGSGNQIQIVRFGGRHLLSAEPSSLGMTRFRASGSSPNLNIQTFPALFPTTAVSPHTLLGFGLLCTVGIVDSSLTLYVHLRSDCVSQPALSTSPPQSHSQGPHGICSQISRSKGSEANLIGTVASGE